MNLRRLTNESLTIARRDDDRRRHRLFERASPGSRGKHRACWSKRWRREVSLPFGAAARKSAYLTHPVFNTHHSETEMLRYMPRLESRDLSLATR